MCNSWKEKLQDEGLDHRLEEEKLCDKGTCRMTNKNAQPFILDQDISS